MPGKRLFPEINTFSKINKVLSVQQQCQLNIPNSADTIFVPIIGDSFWLWVHEDA
jgi:hypothetical protein